MEKFGPDYFNDEVKIGQGKDGIVYSFGEDKAIKFFRQSRMAKKEVLINRNLSKNGICVPQVYGVFCMNFPENHLLYNKGHREWGMVMDKLDGREGKDIEKYLDDGVYDQYIGQLEKILDLGYYPKETGFGKNILYDDVEDKTYFFDFSHWEKKVVNCKLKQELLNGKGVIGSENWKY